MATVRFDRGHWVADYYDTNKRRRIERPKGHFQNLTDELQAAQALLADRLAEVADGLVHEGLGTFEDAATRWLNSKVAIRPSMRRSYQQLLVGYLIPSFSGRTLRLIQVTDIEPFSHRAQRRHSRLDQTGVRRTRPGREAWSRRSPREAAGKSGEDQHSFDQQGAHRSQHDLQLCDAQSMGDAKPGRVCGARTR